AQERAAAAGMRVRFLTADVLSSSDDLGGPYDFFFDRGCYHVVRRVDVQAFLRTLTRITQAGTVGLILTGHSPEPPEPGPPVVSEEEIRAELGSLFDIVCLREFRFDNQDESGVGFLAWSCFVRRSR